MRAIAKWHLVLTVMLAACHERSEIVAPVSHRVTLSVTNLPALEHGEGYYELWTSFLSFSKRGATVSSSDDSGFVSFGKFNITSDGRNVIGLHGRQATFALPPGHDAQLLLETIITIQHEDHGVSKRGAPRDDEPGAAIMGGKFFGDNRTAIADLQADHKSALGTDFSQATGRYTITAPSSPADSNSGIWFFVRDPSPGPGLRNLPLLPPGWRYQGWVVEETNPSGSVFYSTGRFLRADSSDSDGAGPGKGPGAGLNFPGQDFIVAAAGAPAKPDLRSGAFSFMVTVEPHPDSSPKPFWLVVVSSQALGRFGTFHARDFPMFNVASRHLPAARLTVTR